MTWSPFLSDFTPGADLDHHARALVARGSPGTGPSGSAPESVNSSVWQIPVARISTITSPALGPSSCTVSTLSGSPALCATAARTSMPASPLAACSRCQPDSEPDCIARWQGPARGAGNDAGATTLFYPRRVRTRYDRRQKPANGLRPRRVATSNNRNRGGKNGEARMGRALAFGVSLLGGLVMTRRGPCRRSRHHQDRRAEVRHRQLGARRDRAPRAGRRRRASRSR